MKNLTLSLIPLFSLLLLTSVTAQTDLGVQLVAGSDINGAVGLQVRGHYQFDDNWRAGINYIHYFDGFDASLSQKVTEWNADANYIFASNDENIVYALAGFNYTTSTEALEVLSYSEVGWNIGTGGRFNIGEQLAATAELKYIIGNANQLVLGMGLAYTFE